MAPMTLGELINAIVRKMSRIEGDPKVRFDFVHFHPKGIHSYRGDYSQLAIGYDKEGEAPKASHFLTMLQEAEGMEFTGYKGGEFEMTRETMVFVAERGESGGTAIVDVDEHIGDIVLVTRLIY